MITNKLFLGITAIAVTGILTAPISTDAWLYDIYSDKPLTVSDNAVPFIKDYVDNMEEYVEEHGIESDVSSDFIV